MTVLLGPADADHYRIKTGRYKDRWYTDPLPTCPVAPQTDWAGPSVSTTKPPFANQYVPMRTIANMDTDTWGRLTLLDPDTRYEHIKTADKTVSRINMSRGTIVHRYAEDLLYGRPINTQFVDGPAAAQEQAAQFIPALQAFFDHYQPELVAAETVCIHRTLNGVGYGGTSDAFIRINGETWCVDWKSRLSDHAAYETDAAQGGAYIGAEYMVVTGPDGAPARAPIPEVAGVLIVSLRTDGYRAYPIDPQGAIDHYHAMHRWWVAQRQFTDNKVVGRPWPANPTVEARNSSTSSPGNTVEARRTRLLGRYKALTDHEQLAYTALGIPKDADLDTIENGLNQIDGFNRTIPPVSRPPTPPAPTVTTPPEEGASVDATDVAALERRYNGLSDRAKLWTSNLIVEGNNTPHPWKIRPTPTVRRYELYRGVLTLAEWADGATGQDVVHAVCNHIGAGHDGPAGANLAHMGAGQAARFAETAVDLAGDKLAVLYQDDGTPTLTASGANRQW